MTGAWVTGLELVLAPGELVSVGGPVRKDVAGYDIRSLIVGSEGTLGIVTAAWVKLTPAPAAQLPVVAFYPDSDAGCAALLSVLAAGLVPAALEYLDEGTVAAALGSFPGEAPTGPAFMVIAEADGASITEAHRLRDELVETLQAGAVARPRARRPQRDPRAVGMALRRLGGGHRPAGRQGQRGHRRAARPSPRRSPPPREIGARHDLPACSWGHAGDGNLHSTFMLDLDDPAELERAEAGAAELFELAARLGGSVSGEHGTRPGQARRARPSVV